MNFIFTADLHFSGYSSDKIVVKTGLPERLNSLINTLSNMIGYAIFHNIKYIVVGGDILHNKSIIYSVAMSVILDLIRNNKNIDFIFLDGNHDMSSMTADSVSGLKAFSSESNVHTIHNVERFENILFVPWKFSTKEFFKKESADYLISHFGLNEAKLNSGISIVSGIGINDLANFKFVELGHYHRPQDLNNEKTFLSYVGSAIQLDWGEKNDEKRFKVIDTKTYRSKSILTTGYKKYFELIITKENQREIFEKAKELKNCGHEVKICKSEVFDVLDESKNFKIVDKVEKDVTNRGIKSSMTMSEKLEKYLEIQNISKSKIESYKKIGLEIISNISKL